MSAIVGVHGIAQEQLGRHLLRTPWRDALADGLERAAGRCLDAPDLDVAFYGDLFLGERAGDTKGPLDPKDLEPDEVAFLAAAAEEVLGDEPPDGPAPKGFPGLPSPVRRVLAALDRRLGARAGVVFVGELRQVRRYLTEPELRAAADARVAEAVGDGCRVLVGHSLGSVVALEHLRHRSGTPVGTLITLGSPLGLRAIRDLLPPGPTGPTGVRWVNLRDPRDPVALAGGLARWWPAAEDDTVDNGRDPHAATHYLTKRQTGAAVLGTGA